MKIALRSFYGKLQPGVGYRVTDEGRDWYYVNRHYVPKFLCSEYVPPIEVPEEYEDYVFDYWRS